MSDEKRTQMVRVVNPQGLHARPADLLVKTAKRFVSKIELVKGNDRVDAKSILGIFTLVAVEGTELLVEADGPDADEALVAVAELFAQGFAENETQTEN